MYAVEGCNASGRIARCSVLTLCCTPCSTSVLLRAHPLWYSAPTLCGAHPLWFSVLSLCRTPCSPQCYPVLTLWYSPSVVLRTHPCSVLRAASVERFNLFLVTWTALPDLPMPLGYHAWSPCLSYYRDSVLIYCSLNSPFGHLQITPRCSTPFIPFVRLRTHSVLTRRETLCLP